jgi:hypothetical protein
VRNSTAQQFLQTAKDWEGAFVDAVECGNRIQAWEAAEYMNVYAHMAIAQVLVQTLPLIDRNVEEMSVAIDTAYLEARLANI